MCFVYEFVCVCVCFVCMLCVNIWVKVKVLITYTFITKCSFLFLQSSLKKSSPIVFEAKGPSGSVMLIEAISVKTSHTRAELQNLVKKCG